MKVDFWVQFTATFARPPGLSSTGNAGRLTKLTPRQVTANQPSTWSGLCIKFTIDIPEDLVIPTATVAMTETVEEAIAGLKGIAGALET